MAAASFHDSRYLIDTHILIWGSEGDPRALPLQPLFDSEAEIFVSLATLWEIAVKFSIGKLELEGGFNRWMESQVLVQRYELLPLQLDHLGRVAKLPLHHRDPFDRLLIAQAQIEGLRLISADPAFEAYDGFDLRKL